MTFTKLSDDFHQDVRWETAGPLALAVHVAALGHCNMALSDGRLTRSRARILLVGIEDPDAIIDALVGHGFWTVTDDDVLQIVDWELTQWTRDQVLAKRREGADRLAKWRADQKAKKSGNAITNPVTQDVSDSVSNALPNSTQLNSTRRVEVEGGVEVDGAYDPGSEPGGSALVDAPKVKSDDALAAVAEVEAQAWDVAP